MTPDMKEWMDRLFSEPATYDFSAPRLVELGEFCKPDAATLVRLTEVFESPAALLAPYPDGSVDRAFWDLLGSDVVAAMQHESIEWTIRLRFIRSFETLFRELFSVRCQPVLGHVSEEGSPLNSSCYMWWDFDCWIAWPARLARNPLDSAFLASMRSILAIDHVACQESALHGLGHWRREHPEEVECIIDEFTKREPYLRKELREYADRARSRHVL